MLLDPFSRSAMPRDFTREDRVRLLAEAFDALLRGEMPSDEARVFLAGGGIAWLAGRGDLERECWRVSAPAGSHRTPAAVWARISSSRGATEEMEDGTIGEP